LKCPNENAVEHSPKRTTPPKNHKQPMGMPLARPLARPIFPKEKEIYQLNNDEDFSFVKMQKQVIWLCIFIF
jgi:hypothetical protein